MSEKLNLKNIQNTSKGITLVSLVITIIILLILAGVSIGIALKAGMADKAKYASNRTKIETYKEELTSAVIGSINDNGTINYDNLKNNLPEGFEEINGIYIKNSNKYVVNEKGIVDTLLPYGYTECEYLESTGTQYINTGYIPTSNTNINIKYELPSWFNHNQSYTLLGSNSLAIKFFRWSGGLTTTFTKGIFSTEIYYWGFNYEEIYDMSISEGNVLLVNSQGEYKGTVNVDFSDTTPSQIYIWARNTENVASEKVSGKIYYLTISENSVITANLIPALDINNKPCLFDAVSRNTFYNQGTGEFSYKLK